MFNPSSLFFLLPIGLLVTACISPLFTLARLWQVKEWRIDRLFDHLRTEGALRQLFGIVRPLIVFLCLMVLLIKVSTILSAIALTFFIGTVLSFLGLFQAFLQKQSVPVWTTKAIALVGTALLLDAILISILYLTLRVEGFVAMSIVPLLQSFVLLLAWTIWKPIDAFLKFLILRKAAHVRSEHPDITVIGITGSVGKTTTKELTLHVLKSRGAIATPKHVNSEIGVARWLTKTLEKESKDSKKILIVEMGAYRRGEIGLLATVTKPTIGIITYIGLQHVALFGSREDIVEAKGELLESLPKEGHAFLNKDNEAFSALRAKCQSTVTSVGTGSDADFFATDIEETPKGIRFRASGTLFSVPLAGTHTVVNALFAIAVGRYFQIPLPDIARELASFAPLERTFEVKTLGDITVLDDTYNASPDSMRAAIDWAARHSSLNKILVTDGIIELGMEEKTVMASLAKSASDVFDTAYIGNSRFLSYFVQNGFGSRAKGPESIVPSPPGSLIVLIGRLPQSTITKLLPKT